MQNALQNSQTGTEHRPKIFFPNQDWTRTDVQRFLLQEEIWHFQKLGLLGMMQRQRLHWIETFG